MNIDIPQEQWAAIVGSAVMQSITDENRDTLIKEAVTHLLTPQKHSAFGRQRTPLQEAFDLALQQKATEYIREQFEGELGEQVKTLVQEAVVKAFESERRSELVVNITAAVVKAFRMDGY